MNDAPSSYQLQRVISQAQQTIEALRTEHGLVLDSEEDVLAALAEEGVEVGTIIKTLTRAALDSKAIGAAADQRIADLKQRRERFARHEQTYRATVQQVLEALSLKKFVADEFTLSLSAGRPGYLVTDETAVPEAFWRITRAIDKAAVNEAMKQGDVPGVERTNGAPSITIRSR